MSHLDERRTRLDLPLGGVVPPLVTPLTGTGGFDTESYSVLIERVIGGSVHGLFLLGSTGEFCSLSGDVRRQVITEGCRITAGRVPIVVNASDTALEDSLKLTTHAAKAGAAGVAICPPYYLPVTQEDLVRYVQKFAEAADLPVFVYNIPQNAHVEFEVETVLRLAEMPKIVGLKNSNGSIDYMAAVSRVKAQRPEFSLLVGTEEIMMAAIEVGADGSVCGGANMFPALYVRLFEAAKDNRRAEARELQDLIVRIARDIYSVGSAATSYLRGLKGALALLGVCGETLAEPLTAFGPEDKEELHSRLNRLLPEIQ
jgi:2-dehydro-3-deoxy-D-pentonate aldolase